MATARQGKFLVALMAFCRVRVLFPSYAVFVGLVSGFFRRRHVRLVGGTSTGRSRIRFRFLFRGRFFGWILEGRCRHLSKTVLFAELFVKGEVGRRVYNLLLQLHSSTRVHVFMYSLDVKNI